ncbi:hypothetical protein ABTM32_22765, partial [Acinetobacter baumannii]
LSFFLPDPLDRTKGTTYSSAGGYYYAIHYLIADSGNYRALEVVDAYDANGNILTVTPSGGGTAIPMYRQVVFTTRTLAEQNARF